MIGLEDGINAKKSIFKQMNKTRKNTCWYLWMRMS